MGKKNTREREKPRRVTGEQSLSQGAWRKMVAAIRKLAKPKQATPPRTSTPVP